MVLWKPVTYKLHDDGYETKRKRQAQLLHNCGIVKFSKRRVNISPLSLMCSKHTLLLLRVCSALFTWRPRYIESISTRSNIESKAWGSSTSTDLFSSAGQQEKETAGHLRLHDQQTEAVSQHPRSFCLPETLLYVCGCESCCRLTTIMGCSEQK